MPLILVTTANSRTSPLQLAEEVRRIRGALGESTNFTVVHESEIRAADLIRTLLAAPPDILHFAGHGAGKDERALSVKSDTGDQAVLTEDHLSAIFKVLKTPPSLAVLNACYSNELSDALSRWVKVVVGVNTAIPDSVAHRFAGQFYEAIGYSLSIEDAVSLARAELGINRIDREIIRVHARQSDDLQISFASRPELMAQFCLTESGSLKVKNGHYDIELWMTGVDQHISVVTYQLCHKSYKKEDRFWETARSESSEFRTDDFTANGDVRIRATAWAGDKGKGTECSLVTALNRNYGPAPRPEIAAAILKIAKN